MPAKKKAGKKPDKNEEVLIDKLFRLYRKALKDSSLQMPAQLAQKFADLRDEKNPSELKEFSIWEQIGPEGMRAFFDTLRQMKYPHLRILRFWEAGVEDEGVRVLCQFLESGGNLLLLELVNCRITPLDVSS
jgi:hypothetical protein